MAPGAEAPDPARLFLALMPGAAERSALAAHVAAWQWNAQAVCHAPADWHLTLHFIGAVPRAQLGALQEGLVLPPLSPFELRWGKPALWPHGLAVLLPLATPPALQALHTALGQSLRRLGRTVDARTYQPHLTLARHAAQARPPAPPAWGWTVRSYALMASTGQPEARYRVLRRYGQEDEAGPATA